MNTNTNTSNRLLSLPAELRLHIYSYIIPDIPLQVPPSQYTGLVYTCQHLRHEVESLIIKKMRQYFASMSQKGVDLLQDDIEFSSFNTLSELRNLTVKCNAWCPRPHGSMSISELWNMHFDTLTTLLRFKVNPPGRRAKTNKFVWKAGVVTGKAGERHIMQIVESLGKRTRGRVV